MYVALMWIGFANFITELLATTTIRDVLCIKARELMQVMSKSYKGARGEDNRRTACQKVLGFLGDLKANQSLGRARCDLAK